MVLQYAEGGNFNNWIKRDNSSWFYDMWALENIIIGLGNIHEKKMVRRLIRYTPKIPNITFPNNIRPTTIIPKVHYPDKSLSRKFFQQFL